MKTIIINNPGEVDIIEQAMPVRKQGEALLKILYGGICHLLGISKVTLWRKTK